MAGIRETPPDVVTRLAKVTKLSSDHEHAGGFQVRLLISVDGQDNDPHVSIELLRWLSRDPDLRTEASMSLVPATVRPGEMGGAFEAINAVLSSGLTLAGVVVSVASWRDSKGGRGPLVRIERDGVVVEVHDGSVETVERIVRALDVDLGDISATGPTDSTHDESGREAPEAP